MNRHMAYVAAVATISSALGLLSALPATAQTTSPSPVRVHLSINGIDVCGFTVDSVVDGTDTSRLFVDRAGNLWVQDESHIVSKLTNESNGKVVYVTGSGRDRFQPMPVLNPDGTITTTDILTGTPERVYSDQSNVLVKDVGFVSILDTFDSDGNLISAQLVVHGVQQASGPDAAYCAAITSALT